MPIYSGIWPALVTPSAADQTVNESALRHLVEYLIGKGVDGFYVGGTTGEGIFMPASERMRLAEVVLAQVNGRVPVIVHVGAVALGDAIALARHARQVGAVGVSSILPPLYDTLDVLVQYYTRLAAAAPDLPLYTYLLNPNLDAVALLRRLMDIPNLGGTKYTGPNMFEFRQIVELGAGNWTVFSGMDEQCLFAAMMGATGCVGSTLNFMPGVYKAIQRAVQTGDYAQAQTLQLAANQVTQALIEVGFQGGLYEALAMLGLDCGQPRLPRQPLTDSQRAALHRALETTRFRELVAL